MIDYNTAMQRLIEFGTAAAALAEVSTDRDQRIWEAHQAGISKAEIHRVTHLSWATVDRTVREMAEKQGRVLGSNEEGLEMAEVKHPTPQGISRLLAKAGHHRAEITGLAWGKSGYIARKDWAAPVDEPGVRVDYHSNSGGMSQERRDAMLAKYAATLTDAGWHVETGIRGVLIVSAPVLGHDDEGG